MDEAGNGDEKTIVFAVEMECVNRMEIGIGGIQVGEPVLHWVVAVKTERVMVVDVAPTDKLGCGEYRDALGGSSEGIIVIAKGMAVIGVIHSYLIIYGAWNKYGIPVHQTKWLHSTGA